MPCTLLDENDGGGADAVGGVMRLLHDVLRGRFVDNGINPVAKMLAPQGSVPCPNSDFSDGSLTLAGFDGFHSLMV